MNLEHLTLIEGMSFEMIETKIKKANIPYWINEDLKSTYFRAHDIFIRSLWIPKENKVKKITSQQLSEILGYPDHFRANTNSYYAKYQIAPEFDISKLDGRLTFDNGLLIEVTWVHYD